MKNKRKIKLPIRAYLMYALVACFLLSGVTFSRYIASTGTSDSARVAYIGNVQISERGDFYEKGKLMLIPGVDLTKDVRLDYSHTEIASYVFLTVDAPSWNKSADDNYSYSVLDGKVAWSIDKSWTYLTTQDTGERVYYITVPAAQAVSVFLVAVAVLLAFVILGTLWRAGKDWLS